MTVFARDTKETKRTLRVLRTIMALFVFYSLSSLCTHKSILSVTWFYNIKLLL